jgi:hypothetical protein
VVVVAHYVEAMEAMGVVDEVLLEDHYRLW